MRIEAACAGDALVRDQWTGKVGKRAKDMGNKSLGEEKTKDPLTHTTPPFKT